MSGSQPTSDCDAVASAWHLADLSQMGDPAAERRSLSGSNCPPPKVWKIGLLSGRGMANLSPMHLCFRAVEWRTCPRCISRTCPRCISENLQRVGRILDRCSMDYVSRFCWIWSQNLSLTVFGSTRIRRFQLRHRASPSARTCIYLPDRPQYLFALPHAWTYMATRDQPLTQGHKMALTPTPSL